MVEPLFFEKQGSPAGVVGEPCFLASVADGAGVEGGEEVVAFVVDEDEGGEVFDGDFPDGFHAEFGECDDFL